MENFEQLLEKLIQWAPKDGSHLTDEELEELCLNTGTYLKSTPVEEKEKFHKAYRKVERENNEQIKKAGGIKKWYESGIGRLMTFEQFESKIPLEIPKNILNDIEKTGYKVDKIANHRDSYMLTLTKETDKNWSPKDFLRFDWVDSKTNIDPNSKEIKLKVVTKYFLGLVENFIDEASSNFPHEIKSEKYWRKILFGDKYCLDILDTVMKKQGGFASDRQMDVLKRKQSGTTAPYHPKN